jgi:hypothetical protein
MALLVACSASEASPQAGSAQPGDRIGAVSGTVTTSAPRPELVAVSAGRARQSQGTVAAGGGDAPYNYGPTVMADDGRYRMWWCSQLGVASPPGDDILYAESQSLDSGFAGPDGTPATPVFSGSGTGFDAVHACDPSVIRADGAYYLYYTGSAGDHAHGNTIGLATSPDGRIWTRANGGQPIVSPARDVANDNLYGAGQPSAVYLDGWFYLMFTDTTGQAVGPNGAGQFVLRSREPAFASGVEALTAGGFRATGAASRQRSVADAFSADLMWVDALDAFAIAHETAEGTTITFWDRDFRLHPYRPVVVTGPWREGPGLVRRADGHAVAAMEDPCGTVPLDLVRATREGPAGPTDLAHFGLDLLDVGACRTAERALLALDGFAMPSPQRTVDVIISGSIVRVERRSVAEALSVRILDARVPVLTGVPVAAELRAGAEALISADRGVGFVIDGTLWPIGSAQVAERNSSVVLEVGPAEWDSYQRGPTLAAPAR